MSAWAEPDGRALVWPQILDFGALVREDDRYRPGIVLDRLDACATWAPRGEG
ncbi:MAG TPA: hypothetical protein VLK84_26740 [Longimicrobium sp.]|nr:hypothetical protein [Longimicrobium sp.]